MFIVAALSSSGCDFPYGSKIDPPELQTLVREVRIDPNPVAVGDSTVRTAVIKDSLDARFEFTWIIDGTPPIVTAENNVVWTATDGIGTYGAAVTADNGDTEKRPAVGEFAVTVVE